jgi:hypothetical protein
MNQIEKLDEPAALAALQNCEDLNEEGHFTMGGLLSLHLRKKWFSSWKSFDKWVESNTTLGRATARALVQTYDAIVNSGVKWAQVQHIGWTKLRCIAPVLTKDNAEHWIKIAAGGTRNQAVEAVKKHLASSSAAGLSAPKGTPYVWNFTVPEDRNWIVAKAFDTAKEEAGTTHDLAAFQHICRAYAVKANLAERLKKVGFKRAQAALAKAFPHNGLTDGEPSDIDADEESS